MIYIIILFVAGISLIVLETIVPGLIIGIIGFVMLITSIILAVKLGEPILTTILIVSAIVTLPYFIIKSFKRIQLKKSIDTTARPKEYYPINKIGTAITDLHLVGIGRFDEEEYEVYAYQVSIKAGEKIKAIKMQNNRIIVVVNK
jgi:membrane-bound ClpP family serine protease